MQYSATRIYGAKDYVLSIAMMTLPFMLGFDLKDARAWIPVSLGGGALVYSLITNYELGAVKWMSISVHLLLDLLVGVLLAASPWIFGFYEQIFLPHLVLGLVNVGVALITALKSDVVRQDPWVLNLKSYLSNPVLHN